MTVSPLTGVSIAPYTAGVGVVAGVRDCVGVAIGEVEIAIVIEREPRKNSWLLASTRKPERRRAVHIY